MKNFEIRNSKFEFLTALAAGFWLALFALLFTVGASLDLWPRFPAGAFRDTDLLAGLLFGAVLLLMLVRRGRPR